MKKIFLCLIFISSILFPHYIDVEASRSNSDLQLQEDNNFSRNFAEKNGSIYYLNSDMLTGMKNGIYKVSKDLKKYSLMLKGEFSNIYIYGNSIFVFNENNSKLQQYSIKGKLIKSYPKVNNYSYLISEGKIYYYTEKGFFHMKTNGTQNKYIYKPKGSVQEFFVNNGWVYFVYDISLSNDEYDLRHKEYFSKVKISGAKKETVLVKNIENIDSIVVKNGFIYAVIHKNNSNYARNLYRMKLDGKGIKKISSSVDLTENFIGSKYIYYVNNTFASKQSIYRMTLDGKNIKKISTLPGSIVMMEYYNGIFYSEVQPPNSDNYKLHKVTIK